MVVLRSRDRLQTLVPRGTCICVGDVQGSCCRRSMVSAQVIWLFRRVAKALQEMQVSLLCG